MRDQAQEKSPKWSWHGLQKSANILTKCNGIICADCNPRGQAQVKFATWLWLFKCAPRQISAHAEIPDLSIAVRKGANLQSWKTWHYVNSTGRQCTQRALPALYTSNCTFDLCEKMPTTSIPFGETVSYQVKLKELHVLRHVCSFVSSKAIEVKEYFNTGILFYFKLFSTSW